MFNAFGDNRSVGVAGPAGKNAFDLISWTPKAARRIFRESETVNIYFDSARDGVIYEKSKPIGLKNRTDGPKIVSVGTFPSIIQIGAGKFMMELQNSLFKVSGIQTGVTAPSFALFALSFKGLTVNTIPRFIFSNGNFSRAISIQDVLKEEKYERILTIYSSGSRKNITFERSEWCTLMIQYRCLEEVSYCRYILNNQAGELEPGPTEKVDNHTLYIGGHPDKHTKEAAYCAVGSFEMYYSENGAEFLPEKMAQCLLEDILERVDP